jgi:hypothetical protein
MNTNLTTALVTILSADVDEKSGTFTDDDGKDRAFTTRKQKARLEVNGFAYPYEVRLQSGQAPYPAGQYVLDLGAMLDVAKGSHVISRYPVLIPAVKKAA